MVNGRFSISLFCLFAGVCAKKALASKAGTHYQGVMFLASDLLKGSGVLMQQKRGYSRY
jgi:hypothetical protein